MFNVDENEVGMQTLLEINFFSVEINIFLLVASPCYLVFKVVAKPTFQVAILGGHVTGHQLSDL